MCAVSVGILEDEQPQADLLTDWLEHAGYKVFHAGTAGEFMDRFAEESADLLILDWQLPDRDGIEVLQDLRDKHHFKGPILFATARNSEEDIVQGLEQGADDYITKPLRQAELLARLSALCRRSDLAITPPTLTLGTVRLDIANRRTFVGEEEINLTPTEFKLAACVLSHSGKLLSREFLLREVWGVEAKLDTRTVDMHMSRIRKLLKIGPEMGYCIKTIYRHGYRLEAL